LCSVGDWSYLLCVRHISVLGQDCVTSSISDSHISVRGQNCVTSSISDSYINVRGQDCLDLDSLEMCRLRHDLLYTYKIVFNLVSGAANDMFTLANTLYSTRTQGHPYKLYLHNSFIDVRKHFFCERIVITWNNLSATSEHFSSFSQFKCVLGMTLNCISDFCN